MIFYPQYESESNIYHHSNRCNDAHDSPVHLLGNVYASDVRQKSSYALSFEVDAAYCKTNHAKESREDFPTSIAICLEERERVA